MLFERSLSVSEKLNRSSSLPAANEFSRVCRGVLETGSGMRVGVLAAEREDDFVDSLASRGTDRTGCSNFTGDTAKGAIADDDAAKFPGRV